MRQTLHEPSGPEPSGREPSGRERSGLLAACLIGLALGACEVGEPITPGSEPPPEAAPAPTAAGAVPAPQPAPEVPKTAALPSAPKIDDDPARLMGLDRAGLAKLLGDPELMRREPPAEIWQYRGGSCVFDVFLYEQAGQQRVTYLEARDAAARRVGARGCLNELLRARLAKPLG